MWNSRRHTGQTCWRPDPLPPLDQVPYLLDLTAPQTCPSVPFRLDSPPLPLNLTLYLLRLDFTLSFPFSATSAS